MSGLESLAALGLVCNILQLVELGQKTINCIKTVYREGKLDEDLEENAVGLEKLTNAIKRDSRPGNKKYEAILLQSAASCSTAARDLQEELRFLFGNAKRGSFASAVRVTATVKWRHRRLERLGRNLDAEEKRLQTGLLAQVWSSTNAAHIDTRGVRRELRFFIEQYRQGRRETMDLVSWEGLKTREIILRETQRVNGAITLVDQKLDRLVLREGAQTDDEICKIFLKSLKYPEFNQRRNQVEIAFEDTLKWVFAGDDDDESDKYHGARSVCDTDSDLGSESEWTDVSYSEASHSEEEDEDLFSNIKWDSFSNWLRSTDTIYWISGKPGSGKTTLVKHILGHPQTRKYLDVWSPGCEIVSHYFWRPGSPMQKNLEGLFCSLLYQILGKNEIALKDIMSCVSLPKDSFTDWSNNELRLALSMALDSCKNGVCLFLDGLDEVDPGNGTKDGIPELLDLVFEMSQMGNIKFCLASRPTPHLLEMRLSMHPQLRLQDLNYADLLAYAKQHVKYPQTESSEYDNMIDLLVRTAQGVFLWLILAIKTINEGISHRDSTEVLIERINSLPKDLDSLYQDMWARVGADSPLEYRKTAALYFKLLISSQWTGNSSAGKSSAPSGIQRVFLGFNIFDLMLTTTPIADGILDALDDPSKLVDEDVMQWKFRDVERKLKIYCMGLVEERPGDGRSRRHRVSDWSWYGHKYDSVWPSATRPSLDFIHRTASDFLTDTEAGSRILNIDTSSFFTLHCQLMKAFLAKEAIFASAGSVNFWAARLKIIRENWKGTQKWIPKDWDRLVLICEKVANSGRLFAGELTSAEPCGGSRFSRILMDRVLDDELIIAKLKSTTLRDDDKSAILLSLSNSNDPWAYNRREVHSRLRSFRALLRAGADPNWHTWKTAFGDSLAIPQTPWLTYLLKVMRDLTEPDFRGDFTTESTKMAVIASVLISEGANLDDTVDMFLQWSEGAGKWVPNGIQEIHYGAANGVYASVPAHMIINILTETVRLCSKYVKGSCQDRCDSLERACLSHKSSVPCRVFGKLELKSGEDVICETTNEMQTELGNILIEALRRQLSMTEPSLEGDMWSETHESSVGVMTDSIINDESWIETTRGKAAALEWLKDRGLLRFVEKSHTIQEWVEMHRNRLVKSGLILKLRSV